MTTEVGESDFQCEASCLHYSMKGRSEGESFYDQCLSKIRPEDDSVKSMREDNQIRAVIHGPHQWRTVKVCEVFIDYPGI